MTTFKRNPNITLTAMAQWIDSNSNSPDCNQDTLIEYLYHLIYCKAQQSVSFNNPDVYDDFCIFCIVKYLTRLKNKTEAPVKSVVNYIKTVIDPWYNEYVRAFCVGSVELETHDFDVSDFGDYLIDVSSEYDYHAYRQSCIKVVDVVAKHLKHIPHKRNSPEWSNIYISCLLTLNDRIKTAVTLTNKSTEDEKATISRTIRSLKNRPPILYHLEEDKATYISVLVNELVHALAVEISHSIASKVTVSTCYKNLIAAANNDEDE